jgi:hypothetical protein
VNARRSSDLGDLVKTGIPTISDHLKPGPSDRQIANVCS